MVIRKMKKTKLLTLSTLTILSLTIASCAAPSNEEPKPAESNTVPSAGADSNTENIKEKEPEKGDEAVGELGEKDAAAALVNLFLGTMGANNLYSEQIIDRPKDEELYDAMELTDNKEKAVSIARSGETLYMEPVDYENMSDDEIYNYIQANFRNSGLYAMSNANKETPLEITVSVKRFHKLDNGDMLLLDYLEEKFLENEGISEISEYNIDTDKDKTDIVLRKVGEEWKVHPGFIDTYIKGMKESSDGF